MNYYDEYSNDKMQEFQALKELTQFMFKNGQLTEYKLQIIIKRVFELGHYVVGGFRKNRDCCYHI